MAAVGIFITGIVLAASIGGRGFAGSFFYSWLTTFLFAAAQDFALRFNPFEWAGDSKLTNNFVARYFKLGHWQKERATAMTKVCYGIIYYVLQR